MDKNFRREEKLTNEALSKRFTSTFELVNYAIKIAGDMIESGHGPRVNILEPELNIANAVLAEINEEKDLLTSVGGCSDVRPNGTATEDEEE
jgi:hypothetical protein